MMEFGKTLRAAREAKGYTVSQVAEMTRLMSSIIEGFENENFSMIAAPIYGRGFIKLYCEALELDPKPFVAEFMEIFNGNRDLGIKERPLSAPPPLEPQPPAGGLEDAAPSAEMPPLAPQVQPAPVEAAAPPPAADLFATPAAPAYVAPQPPPASAPPAPKAPLAPVSSSSQEKTEDNQRLSRYAAPIREYKPRVSFSLPPNFWRLALLVIVMLVVVWGLCLGVRALYRATSASVPAEGQTAVASESAPAPAPKAQTAKEDASLQKTPGAPAAPREKIEIPPLYID